MSIATNRRRAAWHLSRLGWSIKPGATLTQAIKDFQRGYTRANLKVDGVCGSKTIAAILESSSFRSPNRKGGTASPNFNFTEFRCQCGGRYRDCRRIWVDRRLIISLERYRRKFSPHGMSVISGCRCVSHNRAVGGASQSQHLNGIACDVAPVASVAAVKAMGLFRGIGYARSNKRVCHLDVRRSGSTRNPTTWEYPNW